MIIKIIFNLLFVFFISIKISSAETLRFVCDLEVNNSNVEWFLSINTKKQTIKLPSKTVPYSDEEEKIKWIIQCNPLPGQKGCLNSLGSFNKYTGRFYYFTPSNIWVGKCEEAPKKKLF